MLKQCVADVKAGVYKPSEQAKVVSGVNLPVKNDPTTGKPVQVIVESVKLLNDNELIKIVKPEQADTPSETEEEEEKPKEEDPPAEEKAEEAEA